MIDDEDGPPDWSEVFTPVRGVPAAFRVGPGFDEFIVGALRKQEIPSTTAGTLFTNKVTAWPMLGGGVHLVEGYGGGLEAGVRIFGWRTLRYVIDWLRLSPPTGALAGEETVPTIEELHAARQQPDDGWRERVMLLSGVSDPASLRGFVQRVFGDRGLSGKRRPAYPATGAWGRLGFTMAAAELLEGRLEPDEAARLAEPHATRVPRGENELTDQLSLQLELHGYGRTTAEAVLRELDGEPAALPADAPPHDASVGGRSAASAPPTEEVELSTSSQVGSTLAQAIADRYNEDEDFEPDDEIAIPTDAQIDAMSDEELADFLAEGGIKGVTLVSLRWDNDSGMPNWCGGADLVLLADGSAVAVHKGDSEGGVEPVNLPTGGAARANAIASWLADDFHSGFAALDLEPLDPSDTLSEEAKAGWLDAISESNSHTHVSVGAIEPLVREALGNNAVYARVRDALADPESDEGQLLLTAIRATGDGGNYTYLESGEWEDLDL